MGHRSGKLKQQNKSHKNKNKSKCNIKKFYGEKIINNKNNNNKNDKNNINNMKLIRKNKSKQRRDMKRTDVWLSKRLGVLSNNNNNNNISIPKIIGFISLSKTNLTNDLYDHLINLTDEKEIEEMNPKDFNNELNALNNKVNLIKINKFNQKLLLIKPCNDHERTLMTYLDISKVCDIIILQIDMALGIDDCIDEIGESFITAIKSQGMPTLIGTISLNQNNMNIIEKNKKKINLNNKKKELIRYGKRIYETEFGEDQIKILENLNANKLIRTIKDISIKSLEWRDIRSYMIPDYFQLINENNQNKLLVRGYLRGSCLNINGLIHLPGVGSVQIEQIETYPEPKNNNDDINNKILLISDPNLRESLEIEAIPDPLMGEQTWPTEQELKEAEEYQYMNENNNNNNNNKNNINKKLNIFGDVDPQDAWKLSDDESDIDDDEDDENDNQYLDMINNELNIKNEEEELKKKEQYSFEKNELMRRRAQEEDLQFPDEKETPIDILAKDRFVKYHFLKSFRKSTWDPQLALPRSYSRIYEIEDFNIIKKKNINFIKYLKQKHNNNMILNNAPKSIIKKRGLSVNINNINNNNNNNNNDQFEYMIEDEDLNKNNNDTNNNGFTYFNNNNNDDDDDIDIEYNDDDEEIDILYSKKDENDFIMADKYVQIILLNIDLDKFNNELNSRVESGRIGAPLIISSLLRGENKLSVLHFTIRRTGDDNQTIKSKDITEVICGFRSFLAKPIFSEISHRCDKNKFSRFLNYGTFTLASVFGPVTYGAAPVFLIRDNQAQKFELDLKNNNIYNYNNNKPLYNSTLPYPSSSEVIPSLYGSGLLSDINPYKIILKKIVLTGIPVKVKKRRAIVKYMFYDRRDIFYFKPTELHTKYGLNGKIEEPVGNHGSMKCFFNKVIKQQDTVCLSLYKRVYPKFFNNEVIIR